MRNSKEWFSIAELLEKNFEELPKSDKGISKKAERENWKKQQREGVKGKTFEYHYSSFSDSIQKKLGFDDIIDRVAEPHAEYGSEKDQLIKVPFFNTVASAGFGAFNSDVYKPDDFIGLSKHWLIRRGLHQSKLAFILTSGDSMYPTIDNNDMLLIDRTSTTPKDGQIYVIRVDDQLWVKRVQGIIGGIRLISDNKEIYTPLDIKFDDGLNFEVIGRVVFVGHDLI